jgi:hypothetical protein
MRFSYTGGAALSGDRAKDRAKALARRRDRIEPERREFRMVTGILEVELAGLEPATSWVRSRRSPALSLACLQSFYGLEARSEARLFRPISAHFGWDRAKETPFWPDLGGDAASDGLPLSRELYDDVSRLGALRNRIVHRGERVEENGLSGSCSRARTRPASRRRRFGRSAWH